ncbi:MAG: flagellar hook-length control protein FliK [Pseudolabrys sp.]|nr:flagellar hook-length control protein FliK [Pseudolabrys sp.]
MPQVAFETKNTASIRPPAPASRQAAAPDDAAPFESLLEAPVRDRPKQDDNARASRAEPARTPDARSADKAANKASEKPADKTDTAPSGESKSTAETATKDAAATGDSTATADGADAAPATLIESDAAAVVTEAVATDAAKPAAPAIATAYPGQTLPPADAATLPLTNAPEAGQPAAQPATIQAGAMTVATLQAKTLTPVKTNGEQPAETAVPADAKTTTATALPQLTAAKPQLTAAEAEVAKAQVPVDSQAKPQHAAPPVVDPAASSNAVAPQPSADAPLPSPLTAPQQNTAPPTAAAAVAPAAPSAPQSAAVPLAGVPIAIAGKALEGKNRFEIRLDPAELGRIDVRLDVDRDGKVTARMVVERPDTLDLLRRDAPNLERALQDAGLKTSGNGLQFSLRDQSADHQHNSGQSDRAHMIATDDATSTADIIPAEYRRPLARAGGLDIQV